LTDRLFVEHFDTPTGQMVVATGADERLRIADWSDHEDRMLLLLRRQYRAEGFELRERDRKSAARRAFERYFDGELDALDALPTLTGGTDFQRQVWAALREIPAGTTWSYGALANHIHKPAAVRAVGLANGANPIAIAVPCHRVLGADGTLTGYGGGLARKQWLLRHEGVALDAELPF